MKLVLGRYVRLFGRNFMSKHLPGVIIMDEVVNAVIEEKLDDLKFCLKFTSHTVNEKDSRGRYPLIEAIKLDNQKILETLLSQPDIDVNVRYTKLSNRTPIMLAAAWQNERAVTVLFNLRLEEININLQDDKGETALILAVKTENPKLVGTLMLHPEINVNISDSLGNTALIYAAELGNGLIVRHFLKRPELNISHKNRKGRNAKASASAKGHIDIVELLHKFGKGNSRSHERKIGLARGNSRNLSEKSFLGTSSDQKDQNEEEKHDESLEKKNGSDSQIQVTQNKGRKKVKLGSISVSEKFVEDVARNLEERLSIGSLALERLPPRTEVTVDEEKNAFEHSKSANPMKPQMQLRKRNTMNARHGETAITGGKESGGSSSDSDLEEETEELVKLFPGLKAIRDSEKRKKAEELLSKESSPQDTSNENKITDRKEKTEETRATGNHETNDLVTEARMPLKTLGSKTLEPVVSYSYSGQKAIDTFDSIHFETSLSSKYFKQLCRNIQDYANLGILLRQLEKMKLFIVITTETYLGRNLEMFQRYLLLGGIGFCKKKGIKLISWHHRKREDPFKKAVQRGMNLLDDSSWLKLDHFGVKYSHIRKALNELSQSVSTVVVMASEIDEATQNLELS